MKKVILYTLTICAMLIVTACGGDSNDSGYKTYKEALAANDFEAVHKILDQAEADNANLNGEDFSEKYGFEKFNLSNVKMEVLKSELIYLVSQNGEGINDRIVFLINENKELLRINGKNDDYCDFVATLAANRQNEELIKMLVSLYTDPYLFLDNSAVARYGKDKDFYYELVLDILNNGPKINKEPSLGLVKVGNDEEEELETYRSCISKYNQKCINLIEAFIDKGDIESARKAQRLVKKNIKFTNLGSWKVVDKTYDGYYDAYDVQRDDEDFKKAAKMIKMQS